MSLLHSVLPALARSDTRFEAFGRTGKRVAELSGVEFVAAIRAQRRSFAILAAEEASRGERPPGRARHRPRVALLFRPEETIEFLVAGLAAMAEGFTIAPLYPNWDAATQLLYFTRYRLDTIVHGAGFAARIDGWGDVARRVVVDLSPFRGAPVELEDDVDGVFPDLPADHPAVWIFTSGTSGELAKLTEITIGNLDAAMTNIRRLDFLREDMVVHSPLSASHIFAFVVILGFLALRPRRAIFSDVQYLSRLSEEVTGKVDALILVPIVIHRLRSGLYDKLVHRSDGSPVPREMRRLTRIPAVIRRGLKRLLLAAEQAVIDREAGRRARLVGSRAIPLLRRLLGTPLRHRLGSPEFVVVGGAKPNPSAMALLEVLGVRCLQGWGMTETTGPLAVCHLEDRFAGAFGTCGKLFPGTEASTEDGELIVGGPQIANGYVEPDGTLVPFGGVKRTGDRAEFDARGRLRILGKASDRITTDNGLNYQPVPMEEELEALDLERQGAFGEIVVVGDGRSRLGAVFFPRADDASAVELEPYADELLRTFNARRPIDEKIGPRAVSPSSLSTMGALGPSGKVVRRRVESAFAGLYS